jgi:trans-AT polyketide synthase/acyltransferase/oxidoreductase domain-containing protein
MAAVIGLDAEAIRRLPGGPPVPRSGRPGQPQHARRKSSFPELGKTFLKARPVLEATPGCRMVMPLTVSGAFHSRLMAAAQSEFEAFLAPFVFSEPLVPVDFETSAPVRTRSTAPRRCWRARSPSR